MSELDEKLKEVILSRQGDSQYRTLTDGEIAGIKQLFIDAGWSEEPRQYDKYGNLKINGQEFYDRFEKEMEPLSAVFDNFDDHDRALEAAKRASGLV